MKKILGLIGLVGILLTSCKNDAIDIDVAKTPEPTKTLSLNISTTSGYEPFDLVKEYQDNFLSTGQPYSIALKTYLYDASGNIVDSASSYTKTFVQVSQNFSGLVRGNYTIVTIEMLVNSNYNNTSDFWYIADANQLNTLKLMRDRVKSPLAPVNIEGAIATTCKSVNVTGDMSETLTPSPVGSLVEAYYFDMDKSNYVFLSFLTKNVPRGMMLNPSVPLSERYVYGDYNEKNTWSPREYDYSETGFTSWMSNKAYVIDEGEINWCMGAGTTEQYNNGNFWSFPRYTSLNNKTFEKGKTYYFGLCYTGGEESYDCEAAVRDSFVDLLDWYLSVDKSQQNPIIFEEPYHVWGASVKAVQSNMSAYTAVNTTPQEYEGMYYLSYKGKDKEVEIDYYFNTSSGDLFLVNVFFESNVDESKIRSAIIEDGYSLSEQDTENGIDYYLSADKKTYAAFRKTANGEWVIQYFENVTLYEAPCLEWGASVSSVKNYMANKGYTINDEYELDLGDGQKTYDIVYNPKYKEKYIGYTFDPEALETSYVYFDSSVISLSELEENVKGTGATYSFTSDSGSIYYNSSDGKSTICIGYSSTSENNYVLYWPNPYSTVRNRASMVSFEEQCIAKHKKVLSTQKKKVKSRTTSRSKMTNLLDKRMK